MTMNNHHGIYKNQSDEDDDNSSYSISSYLSSIADNDFIYFKDEDRINQYTSKSQPNFNNISSSILITINEKDNNQIDLSATTEPGKMVATTKKSFSNSAPSKKVKQRSITPLTNNDTNITNHNDKEEIEMKNILAKYRSKGMESKVDNSFNLSSSFKCKQNVYLNTMNPSTNVRSTKNNQKQYEIMYRTIDITQSQLLIGQQTWKNKHRNGLNKILTIFKNVFTRKKTESIKNKGATAHKNPKQRRILNYSKTSTIYTPTDPKLEMNTDEQITQLNNNYNIPGDGSQQESNNELNNKSQENNRPYQQYNNNSMIHRAKSVKVDNNSKNNICDLSSHTTTNDQNKKFYYNYKLSSGEIL